SRLSGRSLYGAGSRNTSATPWRRARSRACASFLLLMTTAIRANSLPASIASMIACRLEPRPEASTPTRSFASGLPDSAFALFNHADPERLVPLRLRQPQGSVGPIRRHHQHQADSHVEHPKHLVIAHVTARLDQAENRRRRPRLARDDCPALFGHHSWQVLGEPATRDMGDRADFPGFHQGPDGPHVDPGGPEEDFTQPFTLPSHLPFQRHLALPQP